MDKISFVLPIKINVNNLGSDLERVKRILFPSLIKYFDLSQIGKFLIIVPGNEQGEISGQLKDFKEKLRLSVIAEEEVLTLVPGWKKHIFIHRNLRLLGKIDHKINRGRLSEKLKLKGGWDNLSGWLKQQLLKLFSSKMIETDFYMTLDADLCLTRPVNFEILFPDGKAIRSWDMVSTHYDWWVGSARILGIPLRLDKEDPVISVTPEILATPVVVQLLDYLLLKSREQNYSTIFDYLITNKSWTEYTLYWLFLLEFYKTSDYYSSNANVQTLFHDGCVWEKNDAPNKEMLCRRIESAFQKRTSGGLFLVVQSNCIPMEEYDEVIKSYLI